MTQTKKTMKQIRSEIKGESQANIQRIIQLRIDEYQPFLLAAKQKVLEWLQSGAMELKDLDETTKMVADNLALNAGYCPPSFAGYANCESCGNMPCYPDMKGQFVLACPWCHTETGRVIREAKIDALKEPGHDLTQR